MLHSDMAHCTSSSYSKSFLFYYVFLVVQDIYSLAQRSQVGCGGLLLDHSAAQVVDALGFLLVGDNLANACAQSGGVALVIYSRVEVLDPEIATGARNLGAVLEDEVVYESDVDARLCLDLHIV